MDVEEAIVYQNETIDDSRDDRMSFAEMCFQSMRIVTWNVNGLRSLIKDTQSIDNLFEQLNADVVCFQVESFGMHYYRQESRLSENEMRAEFIPSEYDVFMTFCTKNSGYAGVCTFVRRSLLPEKSYLSIQASCSYVEFIIESSTW